MSSTTVRTKQELEKAKAEKIGEIIVEGELAKKLHDGQGIASIGGISLGVIAVGLAAIPFTGGLSAVAAAPIAALAGMEVAVIIAAAAIGLGLIVAIYKEYEVIEFSVGPPPKMTLRKKA